MMIDDYAWVLKVLHSSKTENQIEISEKICDLFFKKWGDEISESMKQSYMGFFNKVKKTKTYEIRKNYPFMI